jgi:hypothetical protein
MPRGPKGEKRPSRPRDPNQLGKLAVDMQEACSKAVSF